jgi:hypothetical protein
MSQQLHLVKRCDRRRGDGGTLLVLISSLSFLVSHYLSLVIALTDYTDGWMDGWMVDSSVLSSNFWFSAFWLAM